MRGLLYFLHCFITIRNLRPSAGCGSLHRFEAQGAHLVVVWHPVQRFYQVRSPFEDDFLPREKQMWSSEWRQVLIISHDHIPIPSGHTLPRHCFKGSSMGTPQNGVKSAIHPCSHPHFMESEGEHHWFCKIKHVTHPSATDTMEHSYVYCWIQLRGHLLDDYNRCHSEHVMKP